MKRFLGIAMLLAVTATRSNGQNPIKLQLETGSVVSLTGTSTLHGFTCVSNKLEAVVIVDRAYTKDLTKLPRPIVSVQVEIPVRSLDCGNKKINENMYKTLNANQNPTIRYTLSGYDLIDCAVAGFGAKTTGTLNISGKEKTIGMDITAQRVDGTKATAQGEQSLLMTDFGIKPPKFMLGTLKVGNEIKVKFSLKAGPAMIALLTAASAVESTH